MSFRKRIILYLVRKKGKTLILFLLLFTVSVFILSCFSLLYTTGEVAMNMRAVVGAAFHIRSSVDVLQQDERIESKKPAVITKQAVQEIMSNKKLKYYNGRNLGYTKGLKFKPGAYDTDDNNMGQVSANNYSMLNSYFQEKVLELKEGRHIISTDKNVLLISQTVATMNGLSVGDTVMLSPAKLTQEDGKFINAMKDSKTKASAKIIGIFKEIEPQKNTIYQPTAGLRANMIFSDHYLLKTLGMAKENEYTGGVSFYIQDPLYLETVIKEVKQMDSINWESFFVRKDDWGYEKISEELQMIQNLIKTLLVCASIVSATVLILILTLRMRERIYEAGILMSVGIQKNKILGQFVAEIIIVAVVAFICSYFVAGLISNGVETYIFEDLQIVQIEEQALKIGNSSNLKPSILLNMPIGVTLITYCGLTVVIGVSAMLSSQTIIRLKPREILSKMT